MNNIISFQNQSIRDSLLQTKLQVFEVKQLADMEASYKQECQRAIQVYRQWRLEYSQETDIIELLYNQLRGVVLRRHAENSIRAYWLVRNDFRQIFQKYMNDNTKRVTDLGDNDSVQDEIFLIKGN